MAEKLQPMKPQVGKRYRGSAVYNEFGEFQFRPYQSQEAEENGEHEPSFREVHRADGYRILHNRKKVRVVIETEIDTDDRMRSEIIRKLSHAMCTMREYALLALKK